MISQPRSTTLAVVLPNERDNEQDVVVDSEIPGIHFVDYKDESQIDQVMELVGRDLSEPYSIFTYRYFLHRFPQLCILAVTDDTQEYIGVVVGKLDTEEGEDDLSDGPHASVGEQKQQQQQQQPPPQTSGYIGMLAVTEAYRRQGIGQALVKRILRRMKSMGCSSATLETEVSNTKAQKLYQERFGFIREEVLCSYYLNWNDAYRLRLWF